MQAPRLIAISPQLGDVLLTPLDLEQLLQIKQGTQAAMRHRGQIPFLRLGGGRLIRYSQNAIREWLAARGAPVTL